MTKSRWIEYSVAVLVGNAIYFWVLHPGLPPVLQNKPSRFDLGLVIDFLVCVLVYVAIRLGRRHARRWNATTSSASGKTESAPDRTENSRPRTSAPYGSRRSG